MNLLRLYLSYFLPPKRDVAFFFGWRSGDSVSDVVLLLPPGVAWLQELASSSRQIHANGKSGN